MELDIMYKIKQDKKHYDFLRNNSYWYKYLNSSKDKYKLFLEAYKKYNRNMTTNKVNDTISTIDTVSNILKIIE